MIFQVDPNQLAAVLKALAAFTDQLRRLNENLEAGRTNANAEPSGPSAPEQRA